MDETGPRWIGPEEARAALRPADCIAFVRQAMMALSAGETVQAPRTVLSLDGDNKFAAMAGALAAGGWFGAKLVAVFADPQHPGRQAHRGAVALFDGAGGRLVALADAEEITIARTAAASAVATDALARADASVLAIFGTGAQAHAHVHAIACVRRLERVVIWGRSADRAEALAGRLRSETGLAVVAEASAGRAAAADILCTTTAATTPILSGRFVPPGAHVNLVGSSRPGPVEIDTELLLAGRYIVDSRQSALLEAAEFLAAKAAGVVGDGHIAAEIGEVLLGRAAGRRDDEEITLYKSLGHPVQDIAAAAFLHALGRP
jgi:ornithine cyclodeaminase